MGQLALTSPGMWSRVAVVLLSAASCHAGLLGAGTGPGSCAAAPFRATSVDWTLGCPSHAPCCSEYGYCQIESNWRAGVFRDCNGVSNGMSLPEDAIAAETAAAARGDNRAANLLVVPAGATTAGAAGVAGGVGLGADRAGLGAGGAGFGAVGTGIGAGGAGLGAGGAGLGAGGAGFGAGGAGLGASGAGFGAGGAGLGAGGAGIGASGAGLGAGGAGFGAGGTGLGASGTGFGAGGAGFGAVGTGLGAGGAGLGAVGSGYGLPLYIKG